MAGTKMLLKDSFKKAIGLFAKNAFCFFRIFITYSIPLLILYFNFWDDQELIEKIIDQWTLLGFVLIDDAVNYGVLVYFLFYFVVVVKSIYAVDHGGNPGVIASTRKALGIFGSYLWVKILSLFKILCWSLLLIIPGVIVGVLHNFSGMALLVDGKRGAEALIRSQEIIKFNIKKYLVSYFLIFISSIICWMLITLNLDNVITLFKLNENIFLSRMVIYLEISLCALVASFFLTFYYCLYAALRGDMEG